MFNLEQKERYIDAHLSKSTTKNSDNIRKTMTNFFTRLEEIETDIGKDFAMFNHEEIELTISILCRKSVKYQNTVLSNLRKYLDWAILNGLSLDMENRLLSVKPSDVNFSLSYKISMVKDEDHLNEILDRVMRPREDESVDNMYRLLCKLIFVGFTFDEVLELKDSSVDVINKIIDNKEKIVTLSDFDCDLIKEYRSMTYYVSELSEGRVRKSNIVKTEFLLNRSVDNRDTIKLSVVSALSQKFSMLKEENKKINISPNDILVSGIFYRMYKQEVGGEKINYDEYVLRYQNSNSAIYSPNLIVNDCKLEYMHWKKAFDLS